MVALVRLADDMKHWRVDYYSPAGRYDGGCISVDGTPMTKQQAQKHARKQRRYWERMERAEINSS
jgi:hypothetical protein